MRKHLIETVVLCEECTRNGRLGVLGTVADHVIPKAKGGSDERGNYQLLCDDCSEAKGLADKGQQAKPLGGADRSGRPTSATHPWNRRGS